MKNLRRILAEEGISDPIPVLREQHRELESQILRFEGSPGPGGARRLLQFILQHLPEHFRLEESNGVSGCQCDEHPGILNSAREALQMSNPLQATQSLVQRIREHKSREEEAWV